MPKVVMCQPHNDNIYYQSAVMFEDAAADLGLSEVFRPRSSLLAYAFNQGFARALTQGAEFYVMLHADVVPSANWARQLLNDMEEYQLDIIHAPVRIKDASGCTSTAFTYDYDSWTRRRRLTTKEIARLPGVFTVDDIQERIDEDARLLLPNTGCHAIRMGDWCEDWCYTITDTIERKGEVYEARTLSEDWKIGFDAHHLGLKVGGTSRVTTRHHGTGVYASHSQAGCDVDPQFDKWKSELTNVHAC